MLLPWRRKMQKRIEELLPSQRMEELELNIRAAFTFISWLEGKVDDMAELLEALKKEVNELHDAVAAIHSSVEQLRKAYEYLRDNPKVVEVVKDDPELAAVATEIDDLTRDLAESVAKAGASGGA
jgi:uncharacterized coiled-coil DUF342 family protein